MLYPTVGMYTARHWFTAKRSDIVFYRNDCYKLPDWLFLRSYSFSRQISQILLLFLPKCTIPSVRYHVICSLLVSLEFVNVMKHLETTSAVNKNLFSYIKSLLTKDKNVI